MAPSHKSSSSGSVKSSSNMTLRPKSPVSMYQMDYGLGTPKPPRALVRLEPKSKRNSVFDDGSNHSPSPSLSTSSSFTSSSSSFGTSSTSSTKSRPSSRSLFRLFGKRKASTAPPTIFEPPETPTASPIHSPEAQTRTDELSLPEQKANEPSSVERTNDDEILEVLRESHPGHVTSPTHSRRASLTISPIYGLQEQPSLLPHGTGLPHPPPRPNRSSKRPKTAPSSHSNKRPLPQIPKNETPSIATLNLPVVSGDLNKTTPRPPQTELDNTRLEPPSLSLTRSKSISHSMMMVAPRPDSPFIDVSGPMKSYFTTALGTNQTMSSSAAGISERAQGWSGQWNVDDIQDVIQKLRELK
ncbi:hypothetical protein DFH05DRAFT_1529246 [Lentinula detonsa]|uniref:Uncharacterized protein n=1 Tax=Lentinula detonsa TaxID=2804962 RepID=A0A9W8NTP5_9AGAR|nr:hypothetical protein DFH05DRAFT_1529246 [Lentinula detonsa]